MTTIYQLFDVYFDSPTMTKTRNNVEQDESVYMARLNIQLANQYRYIIATTKMDAHFIGDEIPLAQLKWHNLQTRALPANHNIRRHSYDPKKQYPFNAEINRVYHDDHESRYACSIIPNIEFILLTTKDMMYDYPATGKFNSALETYNTVVRLI